MAFNDGRGETLPVLLGRIPTGAEAEHSVAGGFEAHGGDDVRGLFLAAGAGGTGGDSKAVFVEHDDPASAAIGGGGHEDGGGVPEAGGGDGFR